MKDLVCGFFLRANNRERERERELENEKGGKWKGKMALRPKQQRDTLDQARAIKRSIAVVQTATITMK